MSTNIKSNPSISGASRIYDADGNFCTLEEMQSASANHDNGFVYIYSLNEKTRRVEKTRVREITRLLTKSPMISISTAIGSVAVTKDYKIMVNRDGELLWVEAGSIVKDDLVMAPKLFFRSKKECTWKDAISMKYESFSASNANPHAISAIVGKETQSIHFPNGFNLGMLYYIVGMIDGAGQIDEDKGSIKLKVEYWHEMLSFASGMSDFFMLEPEITGDKVTSWNISVENKIASSIICYALNHLFQQEDEIISHYLSGFLDASGRVEESVKVIKNKKASAVYFDVKDANKKHRIKKALHVFGLLAPKETAKYISVDCFSDIEIIALSLDSRLDARSVPLIRIMAEGGCSKNKNIGFKLGKALVSDRESLGLSKVDLGLVSSAISKYEKDSIVPLEDAWTIVEFLQGFIHPSKNSATTKASSTDLVCSDIVGVRVIDIKDTGEQYAYNVSCENNHNFFANDILCHNCNVSSNIE